jgi:hypothetical protein
VNVVLEFAIGLDAGLATVAVLSVIGGIDRRCEMTDFRAGDRVRLTRCTDERTQPEPGMLGTVISADENGDVHVRWDDGSTSGIVAEVGDIIIRHGHPYEIEEDESGRDLGPRRGS